MTITVIVTLVTALVPSAQVILVGKLTDAVGAGDSAGATLWAVVTGVVVAGYLALQQVMYAVQRMTQVVLTADMSVQVDRVLSGLEPIDIADQHLQAKARGAREAVVEGKVQLQATSLLSLVFAVVVAGSLCLAIGRSSIGAALFVLGCLVPLTVSSMWYAKKDAKIWPSISEERRRGDYKQDQITYQTTATELATLGASNTMAQGAAVHRYAARGHELALERVSVIGDGLAGIVSAFCLIGALLFLVSQDLSPGALAGGAVGILSGILATGNVGFVVGSLMSGANAVERYRAFVDRPTKALSSRPLVDHPRIIETRDLSVRYPSRQEESLSNASIIARQGEMIALVGPNGAGKSTLVKGLMGMAPVNGGSVLFDGIDVTDQGFQERRPCFGLLSQEFGRYELTVRENLLLGAQSGSPGDQKLWEALEAARAADYVRALDGGLDAQLGEQWGGSGLSGGQWQRLALARLMLRDAAVWILDEPTSAIDAEAEEEIFAELHRVAADHITIVVSHRAWTLRHCDRIYVVDGGRIVESGSFQQLKEGGGRFAALFATQNAQ
ncbi:ATP-binding cassette domain-containing protein [Devriesea agamarum]|uniref:ATP-binding cassette domain-containing protein n=1 Tax=Devriesea agamarum TaxID=472569 RepID=UPI00071E4EB0|nr:ABC transporter ATP-binding protein [Devriesea agamarum]